MKNLTNKAPPWSGSTRKVLLFLWRCFATKNLRTLRMKYKRTIGVLFALLIISLTASLLYTWYLIGKNEVLRIRLGEVPNTCIGYDCGTQVVRVSEEEYRILEKIRDGQTQENLKRFNEMRSQLRSSTSTQYSDKTESVYEVKKGDTLDVIARLFGVSKETIIKANNLKTEDISVGDILNIPNY